MTLVESADTMGLGRRDFVQGVELILKEFGDGAEIFFSALMKSDT